MARKLFGTDGVRGVANSELSPALAMDIGKAAVQVLSDSYLSRAKILIGKDTRVSSDMLESALAAGICSMGADVVLLGFIPTPAVAYLVKQLGASLGIVVSASHNPVEFNGIKILGPEGFKLADELEEKIEKCIDEQDFGSIKIGAELGSVSFHLNAVSDYVEHLKECIPGPFAELKVAVDCANGAAFDVARKTFAELNINATFTAVTPNGSNINDKVGSTHIESIAQLTVSTESDIGIAYDGDADRCLAVDENGELIDGDKIIAIFAKYLKAKNRLAKDTAVVTVMSNPGFFEFCKENDINVATSAVGDRYVLEEMLIEGYVLGGEQSGHVILFDYAKTGDGVLTSLLLLKILAESSLKASELAGEIFIYPQVLKSVAATANQKKAFNESEEIKVFIADMEKELTGSGRILVRCSGTEPIIRVLVEGRHIDVIEGIAQTICSRLEEMLSEVV